MIEKMNKHLQVDFRKDWINNLRSRFMSELGIDPKSITDEEIPSAFWHAYARRVRREPRQVFLSDTFICPANVASGWRQLRTMIENGDDLTTRLSHRIEKTNARDALLSDWGVHHFHLGVEPPYFRSSFLLFALVTNNYLYAINIYPHGAWAKQDIVETLHRNWPQVISHAIAKGVTPDKSLTESQRKVIRQKNANTFVTVSDGTTYHSIGGGVVASGDNFRAWHEIDSRLIQLDGLEQTLRTGLPKLAEILRNQGYDGQSRLVAKLDVDSDQFYAYFPDYHVRACLGQSCPPLSENRKQA